jgi:hypothetical protein
MHVAAPSIARTPDGANVTVATTITGGKVPYIYSIVLGDGTSPTSNETNTDGRILRFLTNPPAGKATLNVRDSSTNRQEKIFEISK